MNLYQKTLLENPIDHLYTNLYSNWGSLSYAYQEEEHNSGKSLQKGLYPPLTIPIKHWRTPNPVKFPDTLTLKGLQIVKHGNVKVVDPEMYKNMEGVIADVIKSLAVLIFTGGGMVNISLPARIFEPLTSAERIAETMGGYPYFLDLANKTQDPVERIKLAMCGMCAGLTLGLSQKKPFHSLLGETLQKTYRDGTMIYMEHTNYNPAITNFLMIKEGSFKIWGRTFHGANVSTNKLDVLYKGPMNVKFSDGTVLTMYFPIFASSGLMWGDRLCWFESKGCFHYPEHGLKGFLNFGKLPESGKFKIPKRKDCFSGSIYKYDSNKAKSIDPEYKKVVERFKMKDMTQKICDVQGSYLESLWCGETELWNIKKDTPLKCYNIDHPIPSDFKFREDVSAMYWRNMKLCEKWKIELERVQRTDRKLRTDYIKKHKIKE